MQLEYYIMMNTHLKVVLSKYDIIIKNKCFQSLDGVS